MPLAPAHACATPLCPNLVPRGVRHCAEHTRVQRVEYDQRGGRRLLNLRRWRRMSAAFLRQFPLCAEHRRRGEIAIATETDHIVPHRGDLALFWDRRNWQPLCRVCHSAKTRGETLGVGRGAEVASVELADGRRAVNLLAVHLLGHRG